MEGGGGVERSALPLLARALHRRNHGLSCVYLLLFLSMNPSKLARVSRNIEMVETHNIALSLVRIQNAPGYQADEKKKRALYHAICMTNSFTTQERVNLRAALYLP